MIIIIFFNVACANEKLLKFKTVQESLNQAIWISTNLILNSHDEFKKLQVFLKKQLEENVKFLFYTFLVSNHKRRGRRTNFLHRRSSF